MPEMAQTQVGAVAITARIPSVVRHGVDAILASYSQVLFSRSRLVGVLVMAATFVVPAVGLVGLLGVSLAAVLSLVLGFDRESVRTGVLGYNALLVFLMVGAFLEHSPAFWVLAAVMAGAVVLIHVALSAAMTYHLRLPVLSLPFVFVAWIALASVPYVRGMAYRTHVPALEMGAFPGPALIDTFLRSLGAMFFQPHWIAGLLVLTALVVFSRIATLHALVGFGIAVFADTYLFTFPPDVFYMYVGFNFIMTAVALGGIFYVPGPSSLALAAFGALITGLLSVGALRLLQPVALPILALPLNLTVLGMLYALNQRRADASPRRVDFLAGSPEDNLNHYRTRVARFRSALLVPMRLPFRGTWVCTQGNDGAHTHQGAWRHGLDFEVADRNGDRCRGEGDDHKDWLCYGLPVLAPAAGTVVRVIDGLADTPIGDVNTENNWGNLVVIQHAVGLYSLMAHLQSGSFAVTEGQVVAAGQTLAKVGSSGRSPVPHLHVQLQATPDVGAPTLPIEFSGVVLHADAVRLEARHLPRKDERMRSVVRKDGLARALALPPGERLTVQVTTDGGVREEELISDIDAIGSRSLVSPSRDARLWFENRGDTFVTYDVAGPRDSALFALYAALARCPLEDASELHWSDRLNPRRLGTQPMAWLRDALAAVIPPADQGIAYVARRRGELVVVEGTAPGAGGQRAVRTEASIRLGEGLVGWSASVGSRTVSVEVVR
jgi:urea transporter